MADREIGIGCDETAMYRGAIAKFNKRRKEKIASTSHRCGAHKNIGSRSRLRKIQLSAKNRKHTKCFTYEICMKIPRAALSGHRASAANIHGRHRRRRLSLLLLERKIK